MSPVRRAVARAYTAGALATLAIAMAFQFGPLPFLAVAVAVAVTAVNAWLMLRTVRRAEAEVGQ